jgi:uncharacterized membrane protein
MNKILQYMFLCHRLPERSFSCCGKPFPICARCTGIFAGYFIGIIYAILFSVPPLWLAFVFILPTAIDGGGQFMGYWISNNIRRFWTGILAGMSVDYILYYIAKLGWEHGQITAKWWFS